MKLPVGLLAGFVALSLFNVPAGAETLSPAESHQPQAETSTERTNPLLQTWETPHGIPPFSEIGEQDYLPAFEAGFAQLRSDLQRIRDNPAPADFNNTVLALEHSGALLSQVRSVFNNTVNIASTDHLLELEEQLRPQLIEMGDLELLDEQIFQRLDTLYQQRDQLNLGADELRLLMVHHQRFLRSGAKLDEQAQRELSQLNSRLAALKTRFAANVLHATEQFSLLVQDEKELAGLSAGSIRRARQAAEKAGYAKGWLFGLSRSVFENFMSYSEIPDLRRQMLEGYRNRGILAGPYDNRKVVLEIAELRAQIAALLGYSSHAEYQLETRMAKTPQEVDRFLREIWQAGLSRASQELQDLQDLKQADGYDTPLEAWDWWYYARKLRRTRFQVTEQELRPYFELQNVRQGAMHVAGRLFGVRFEPLDDAPAWHPDVKAWEVFGAAGEFLGVYLVDDYARHGKRGGSWKSQLRAASVVDGESIRPIVVNNTNLPKPVPGQPTLLNLREVRTLFHEFGHALQSLVTTVPYASISGSSGTPRDYREFPSQFYERYAMEPQVLKEYARHYESGALMPAELVTRIQLISDHNQGFKTAESIAASILDLSWHELPVQQALDVADALRFEEEVIARLDPLPQIGPRYRSAYFSHIFSGGYSAGYYAYLWSEVLDADGFSAFLAAGDIFDPELSKRLKQYIFESGSREDADVLYRKFRGRDPTIDAFLQFRGLANP